MQSLALAWGQAVALTWGQAVALTWGQAVALTWGQAVALAWGRAVALTRGRRRPPAKPADRPRTSGHVPLAARSVGPRSGRAPAMPYTLLGNRSSRSRSAKNSTVPAARLAIVARKRRNGILVR